MNIAVNRSYMNLVGKICTTGLISMDIEVGQFGSQMLLTSARVVFAMEHVSGMIVSIEYDNLLHPPLANLQYLRLPGLIIAVIFYT